MLNEVVSYIEQCLRSHLNPRCKPVFVSFRPSRPPPQFYLLVSVSPTDVFLSSLFFPPSFPLISPLFRTFYLLYRLGRGPSVLLRGSFPIVEPARHYVAAPLRTSCIAASRLRSVCYTEGNIALQLRSSLGTIIRCYVS